MLLAEIGNLFVNQKAKKLVVIGDSFLYLFVNQKVASGGKSRHVTLPLNGGV